MRVYCFTNQVNSKSYVSVTSQTLNARWDRHVASARNNSSYRFHQAIRKHGNAAFEGVVIEDCSTTEEAFLGRTYSEETRKKISESQKLRLANRRMNREQNKDTI